MLTTISQPSSSVTANGSMMPSWHYGNGSVGMTIPGANGTSMCGVAGASGSSSSNTNNNLNNVNGNISPGMGVVNTPARLMTLGSTGSTAASSSSGAGNNMGAAVNTPGEMLNVNAQIKCDSYSPTGNLYGSNNSSSDFEPGTEFRARANTWHAEKKRPERHMLESLLEEDDDSPDDSLSGIKPESLSPLGDSSLMAGSPASPSGGANSKKISRRNAWGNLSYADLITKAIECSPEKRLTLSQIYDWMVQNIPYFKDKGDTTSSAGWKNSIRHNLSLHTRFMRLQNESSGKSSWWVINPDASKGGKSPRRRAASIDTKNFERKRGRVKKRLSALHGSTSTEFASGLGARNMSTSSMNSTSASAAEASNSHHDYRPVHFGSSTASLESRLQHLAGTSHEPCWSDAQGGPGSTTFEMELDSASKPPTDSYHQQMFGGASQGRSASYGSMPQAQQGQAASTPPHLTTTYLQLQGSYHLAAVANTPNGHHHHHHGSPGSAAAPAAMGTFHTFHSSPFGQHPTASASSYNMPSYHLQSMSSYNNGSSNAMTHSSDTVFPPGNGQTTSQSVKSYSSLQPVAMNSFKAQQQQAPNYSQTASSNSGLVGTIHHHTASNVNHPQPSQLNQQQQLLGLGAGNNSVGLTSTPPVASGLPQDLDFFEPFSGTNTSGGILGLNGSTTGGPGNANYFDIADMDSTIGKDLCTDSSLDVNLEFESLLSSSQMS